MPDASLIKNESMDPIWSVSYGFSGNSSGNSVINCRLGGFLLVGSTYQYESWDIFLLRVAENGNVLWTRTFGGQAADSAASVIECLDGGFAIIGTTNQTGVNPNAILICTDANGYLLWSQTYGGELPVCGYDLIECVDGGFAVVGSIVHVGKNGPDFWLIRTNDQGTVLWNHTYSGEGDAVCYSTVNSNAGGFVLAGSTESNDSGYGDVWIICTDSMGTLIWQQVFGGPRNDNCCQVIKTQNFGYCLVGNTQHPSNLVNNAFVLSTDSLGTEIWNTTINGNVVNTGNSITQCSDGGYVITGFVLEWVNNVAVTNLYVTRLDLYGNFQWSKSYGGLNIDIGYSIIQTPNGELVVAGITNSFAEEHSNVWLLRIPDLPFMETTNHNWGPPNLLLIGLGIFLASIITLSSFLLYSRSREEISKVSTEPSRKELMITALSPYPISDLKPILFRLIHCRRCGILAPGVNLRCPKCNAYLHRCVFCNKPILQTDYVSFCFMCGALAHHEHMKNWLLKRSYCPQCGKQLRKE
ncbi:MAG: hypothetical protein ACFFD8_06645 [Candidatus Thorarchaeota archaeon]